jgi:RNA polymerase sigma-70 factor (ECF subfamily)
VRSVSNDPAIDQACLFALQDGDAAALNRLIVRWQRPLHSFAYRYCQNRTDAEDLVAQTFVRLYQQRIRFRPDTNLSAWLFTTLTNFCHNHHRWKRRHPTTHLESRAFDPDATQPQGTSQERLPSEQLAPNQALEHDELLTAVRTAIAHLPHDLKVTLLLHHYDRLSYREIAAITGCSERGVETRLYRARIQLRELLSRQLSQSLPY